ncbi:MAG: cyclic pyranopterin monophosphate synthase MoaC [Sedimentisphaerales bacterium]|nr:cyclic pyranopterin monophosphate synthase MoaC [Sedimentisphaerales bacterium]
MKDSGGMIDISGKSITVRIATARGAVRLSCKAFDVLQQGACQKGDVLVTARIAAIQAVKSTSTIIPMCHPVGLESVDVSFDLDETVPRVVVTVTVRSCGKTGVEMEALCGVSAACLTVYDMLKYTGQDMTIEQIRLMEKSGGRSGHYKRSD